MAGSWGIQVALLRELKQAGVADGRVYDHAGPDVAFPYVDLGETQSIKDDVQCRDGEDEFRTLHIWSRYRGAKELYEIEQQIKDAVHGLRIEAGDRTGTVFVRDMRTLEDPDTITRHGVLTLRIQHFGPKET